MKPTVEFSVIVPVVERFDDVEEVYRLYRQGVEDSGKAHEFIYVIDGDFAEVLDGLRRLIAAGERIQVIQLARRFGEATALTIGIQHASGDVDRKSVV